METNKDKSKQLVLNRKMKYEYFIHDTIRTGIVLSGPEVRAIRDGKCRIDEAYVTVDTDGQLKVLNMYITTQSEGFQKQDPDRERILLARKKEIQKLSEFADVKGQTLVPFGLFDNGKGLIKMVVALCKGKKDYDKRQSIKEREHKLEMDRVTKSFE